VQSDELGQCIRAWRDRLDPAASGAIDRRVTPGVQRMLDRLEELGTAQGADLRLIVCSTAPDSPDAEALARPAELVLEGVPG
jgi:hypothetical protein